MDQKIIDLYKKYTKGLVDRREFLKELATIVGGTTAALVLLQELEAQTVSKDDPRLHTEYIRYSTRVLQ